MTRTTITETCGCGANFTTSSEWASDARTSAAAWRDNHKHAESVGICGDRPPPLMLGGVEISRPHCELKAGHDGMHSDGQGHWQYGAEVDDEEFCPKCFAGIGSSEHHEKCGAA